MTTLPDIRQLLEKAAELEKAGKHRAALKPLLEATKLDPSSFEAWFDRGICHELLGEKLDASHCYRHVIGLGPSKRLAEAHLALANIYASLGKHSRATKEFIAAVQAGPDKYLTWYNLGIQMMDEGRTQEALLYFDKALSLNPGDADVLNSRGNLLTRMRRYKDAIESFDRLLDINKEDARAWLNIGVAYLQIGNDQQALACYKRALEIKPEYTAALVNVGSVFDARGKHKEALGYYNRALELDPKCVSAWNNKGWLFQELKKYPEALECYEKALSIDPGFKEALENKKGLQKQVVRKA